MFGKGALALVFALWGCAATQATKPGADAEVFAIADARCTRAALRAAPRYEPRVIPCDSDRSYMNCSTRSAFASTLAVPTPAEIEAIREASQLRKRAYAACMAQSGMGT